MEAERTVDLDGPIHYVEWEGSPERTFVLVHGLGGTHANWLGVAPGLARHGRVLALDLPGFGLSPRAGRSPEIEANRRALSRFVREVASGLVVLAGGSMGGTIALLQAAREPASVAAVIPTCPALPFARGGVPSPLILFSFSLYRIPGVGEWVVRRRLSLIGPERQVRIALRIMAGDPESIPEEIVRAQVEALRAQMKGGEAADTFAGAARSLIRLLERPGAFRATLRQIECPVLLLHGRRDRLVPAAYAEAAFRENPRWRLRCFPDLGHIPHIEAPERWLAAAESFLEDFGLVAPDA